MLSKHIFKLSYHKSHQTSQVLYKQKVNIIQIRSCNTKPEPPKQYSKEAIMASLNSLTNEIKNTTYIAELNDVANNVMSELEKKKFSMVKFKIAIGIVVLIIVMALYDVITSWMSGQVNVITEKSLEDEVLRQKIVTLCEHTVKELVKSKTTQDDIAQLTILTATKLMNNEHIQIQLTELLKKCVSHLAHDESVQRELEELFKPVVGDLTENPEIKEKLKTLLITVIGDVSKDENVKNDCGQLGKSSLCAALFSSNDNKA